ncbi:hypothetical protein [Candidatus Enterovibrio altilux]|uniref:Mobile element protein n=1 Tax=Candidatus Enterovibrio altilux TaxID=1927128 RepID=A0A291B716_9GAMM|nr:hypothetical protein [Candidatus Enterovibrio luxaltus]ATF08785.1 Mobile element protein [Candidatus Enterovibrio luxaltus]
MFRVKKPLRRKLNFRDHNAQISEIYAMVKALDELTELSMPKTKAII